jgi:hypothetical protein
MAWQDSGICMCAAQAIFVVHAAEGVDFGALQALLAARGRQGTDLETLRQECKLRVAYPLGAGGSSSAVPSLRLHLPQPLECLIGGPACWHARLYILTDPYTSEGYHDVALLQARWSPRTGRRTACALSPTCRRCACNLTDSLPCRAKSSPADPWRSLQVRKRLQQACEAASGTHE